LIPRGVCLGTDTPMRAQLRRSPLESSPSYERSSLLQPPEENGTAREHNDYRRQSGRRLLVPLTQTVSWCRTLVLQGYIGRIQPSGGLASAAESGTHYDTNQEPLRAALDDIRGIALIDLNMRLSAVLRLIANYVPPCYAPAVARCYWRSIEGFYWLP